MGRVLGRGSIWIVPFVPCVPADDAPGASGRVGVAGTVALEGSGRELVTWGGDGGWRRMGCRAACSGEAVGCGEDGWRSSGHPCSSVLVRGCILCICIVAVARGGGGVAVGEVVGSGRRAGVVEPLVSQT